MAFEAQVADTQLFSTERGQRLYVVFKSVERNELGLWLPLHWPEKCYCQVGDVVFLKRDRRERSQLALHPLPYIVQIKLFSWLNQNWLRFWRATSAAHESVRSTKT